MTESKQEIYSTLTNNLGEIVLNRPTSHNAISRSMWLSIPQHLRDLQNSGATIVVIRGEGESFAAGADIMELKELSDYKSAEENWNAIANALEFLYMFELPVIAAIDGACLGGGCLLATACDLRYASERSSFSVPIARMGIAIDDTNLSRLACLIGVGRAKEMIFRARRISADEALSWGLLNDVFSSHEFQSKLALVLAEIMANSAFSIKEAKASFARSLLVKTDSLNHETVVRSYLLPDAQDRLRRALNPRKG